MKLNIKSKDVFLLVILVILVFISFFISFILKSEIALIGSVSIVIGMIILVIFEIYRRIQDQNRNTLKELQKIIAKSDIHNKNIIEELKRQKFSLFNLDILKKIYYQNHSLKVIVKNPEEHIQKNWMRGEFYEAQENGMLPYIGKHYKKGIFMDIGSCIGNHSLFFSAICEADLVLSFEPHVDLFEHQKQIIELNNIENIKVFNLALGDSKGKKGINKADLSRNIGKSKVIGGNEIVIDKLDNVVEKMNIKNIDLIKIDVEGYNIKLLKGAIKTLKKFRPDIFIEFESEDEKENVTKFLSAINYNIVPNLVFNYTPTYLFRKVKY